MIGGEVRHVRELKDGVQAEVTIGATQRHGYARVTVLSTSPEVKGALVALKVALRNEADTIIRAAQEDERQRGRRPIGEVS